MTHPSTKTVGRRRPRVLVVTPEIAELPPVMGDYARGVAAKGSGLADMTAALISSLLHQGADVHVALPHYRGMFAPPGDGLGPWSRTRMTKVPGSRLHLAEDRLFYYQAGIDSHAVNGDLRPALFFQREVINHIVPWVQPDLIHCHDWMTGLIPPMARRMGIPCLFTLHNPVSHHATLAEIEETGIDAAEFWQYLYYEWWPGDYETTRSTNPADFLTSAVIAADYVNTTSQAFLAEILHGADDVVPHNLQREMIRKADEGKVCGIPAAPGRSMRPSRDPSLTQRYSAPRHRLGKYVNKAALRRRLGLPHKGETPLIFCPSRGALRRGSDGLLNDVIPLAISRFGDRGLQIVAADTRLRPGDDGFTQTTADGASVFIGQFDEELLHLGYAASDFTLIASPSERYATAEAVSMIYGSLPLTPASGEPSDTLVQLDVHADRGNAFPFRHARVGDVAGAIERAMQFHQEPESLRAAQVARVMKESASAHRSSNMARRYSRLYEKLLGGPIATHE